MQYVQPVLRDNFPDTTYDSVVPHGHSKTIEMGRQDPCAPAGVRSCGELLSSLLGLGWTWSFVLPTAASINFFLLFRKDWGVGNNPIQTFPRANLLTDTYTYTQIVCILCVPYWNLLLLISLRRLFPENKVGTLESLLYFK